MTTGSVALTPYSCVAMMPRPSAAATVPPTIPTAPKANPPFMVSPSNSVGSAPRAARMAISALRPSTLSEMTPIDTRRRRVGRPTIRRPAGAAWRAASVASDAATMSLAVVNSTGQRRIELPDQLAELVGQSRDTLTPHP